MWMKELQLKDIDVFEKYKDRARIIAAQMSKKINRTFSFDEIFSFALEGLNDIQRKKSNREISATYVNIRIKGHIIDCIRRESINKRSSFAGIISLSEFDNEDKLDFMEDENYDFSNREIQIDMESSLKKILPKLTFIEKVTLNLYYFSGFSLKEVGNTMGLTEAYICQINKDLLKKIKSNS